MFKFNKMKFAYGLRTAGLVIFTLAAVLTVVSWADPSVRPLLSIVLSGGALCTLAGECIERDLV